MGLEAGFDVRLRSRDGADAEGIHECLEDVGADKSRQRRAKADILHTELQQGQEDGHGFLLVPGNIVDDRQIVDIVEAEDLL